MIRNWWSKVNFPSKDLRAGAGHLVWDLPSIPIIMEDWRAEGQGKSALGSCPTYKITVLPATSRVTWGSSGEMRRCPLGAMEVPRLHQSLDPSASLVWQPRVSYRTGGTAVMLLEALSFVHLSGRVLVDFSQTGSIRPPGCRKIHPLCTRQWLWSRLPGFCPCRWLC